MVTAPIRELSPKETETADELRQLGVITRYEWMAAFDIDTTKRITFRTDRRIDGTDAGEQVEAHWKAGGSVIVHHNHPSDESLSHADWQSLLDFAVSEIFAHTTDGSTFYGRLLDPAGLANAMPNYDYAGDEGERIIIDAQLSPDDAPFSLGNLLRKHLVALALMEKGYVDYRYWLGPVWQPIEARYAKVLRAAVSAALTKL